MKAGGRFHGVVVTHVGPLRHTDCWTTEVQAAASNAAETLSYRGSENVSVLKFPFLEVSPNVYAGIVIDEAEKQR